MQRTKEFSRILRKVVYGLTQKEVNEKLDNLKQMRKHGAKSIVGKDTLAGYLHRWLEDDVAVNLEDNTYDEYERCCRLYINPFIGHIKLKDLTSEDLIGWQAKLSRKNFSANMRARGIKTLTNALSRAVQLRLIPADPCAALNRPKVIRKETIPLEPEQCHILFDECEKHRIGDIIILAAMTGLTPFSAPNEMPRSAVERMCDPWRFALRRKTFPAERTYQTQSIPADGMTW